MFEGQYNEAYKEIEIEYSVKLNLVVPNNRVKRVTQDQIDKWFRQKMEILQSGVQLKYGNTMQQITVEKK